MDNYRYSAAYVRRLSDADGRRYLETVGLPVVDGVFEPVETPGALLVIGQVADEGTYHVDLAGGQVVYVSRYDSAASHANASVRAFGASLGAFLEATSHPPADADLLEASLAAIDPTALHDPDGLWGSLLFDVSNGDYDDD